MTEARAGSFSRGELTSLLALTALPVVLTGVVIRMLTFAGMTPRIYAHMHPSYVAFIVYTISNWVTFGIVLAIAGRERLRAHGLRLRFDARRCAAAVMAFFAGLAVFSAVAWVLAAVGLPGVGGMDYPTPGFIEVVILSVCVVATAAFCEEVFFRVLWIGALGDRIPIVTAALASLGAFAVIHYPYFGIGGVAFISVWAALPAALFITFGDVSASLAMHLLNNAFAYIIIPLLTR